MSGSGVLTRLSEQAAEEIVIPSAAHVDGTEYGFRPDEVATILQPFYSRGERLISWSLYVHFLIAVLLAGVYSTWLVSLTIATIAVGIFEIARRVSPHSFLTRCTAGISLQTFTALHIYQMHGLPEMHFFFFTGFTVMIAYYDSRAMWPATILIIGQHILFAMLTNEGVDVYFFPESYVGFTKLFFHFGIAIVQVVVCGFWAWRLRADILIDAWRRREMSRLTLALAYTHNAVAVMDREQRINWVNPAFCSLFGIRADEAYGCSWNQLHSMQVRVTDTSERLLQSFEIARPFDGEIQRTLPNGEQTWIRLSITPLVDSRFGLFGFVAIGSDVTHQRRAVEMVKRNEARFRALVEKSNDGIVLLDEAGHVKYAAPNVTAVFGVGSDSGLTVDWPQLIHPEDVTAFEECRRACLLMPDKPFTFRHRTRALNGEWVLLEGVLCNRLHDPVVGGIVGNFRDVTLRERMENELRSAQRMEAVGQLAGGIAHDFNNLLTVILGNLPIDQVPSDSPIREKLETIERAALRAADLTGKLLAYARRKQLQRRPIRLSDVVVEATQFLQRTIDPRIVLLTNCAEPDLYVFADSGQLLQVVLNLALNARDAMPTGGCLTFHIARVVRTDPEADGRRGGEFVCLRVIDTGVGISPEVQERLFEPFFTTKPLGEGTGLGLAMSFGIVQQHGGWIECRSELGAGTEFSIYLPSIPKPHLDPTSDANNILPIDASPHRQGGTILVADDEEPILTLVRSALEPNGYHVLTARNGLEALDILERERSKIDLIVLDLTMPELSGQETLERIRRKDDRIPILLCSGYSRETLTEQEERRIAGFLAKPYRPSDLINAIRSILHHSSPVS